MRETFRLYAPTSSASGPVQARGTVDTKTSRKIGGYAHRYGIVTSCQVGGARMKIMPGAFAASREKTPVHFFWQHDGTQPLAITGSNMTILDTREGLGFVAHLPATAFGEHVYELIRLGVVREMSIGIEVESNDPKCVTWDRVNGSRLRVVHKASLYEISAVTKAAQPEAGVAALAHNRPIMEQLRRICQYRRLENFDPKFSRPIVAREATPPARREPTVRELNEQEREWRVRTPRRPVFVGNHGGIFG